MSSVKSILIVGTIFAAWPNLVLAQDVAGEREPLLQPAPSEETTTIEDIVVTGRPNNIRSSIDSTSYSLADDVQAATGSLADALRNIPSVDVDPQGAVSLRGDPDVTILIDGRRSGALTGEGRAQALLQLSAGQYSRIEVMTNPSAAYSPDGAGGVINLITKPSSGRSDSVAAGSVRAGVGEGGRWNLGVSGSWSQDRLTISADLGVRHDLVMREFDRIRDSLNPTSGEILQRARQSQRGYGDMDIQSARLGAEYRVAERLQLTGELRGNVIDNAGRAIETYETTSALGFPVDIYTRDRAISFEQDAFGATTRVLRQFGEDGHEWTTELRADRTENRSAFAAEYEYDLPASPPTYEQQTLLDRLTLGGLSSTYVRPTAGDGKLSAGYELETRASVLDTSVSRGADPHSLVPDISATNRFEADQVVHAVYATWERPFGDLSTQLGLRFEYADLNLNQVTTGVTRQQDYFRAYPTLHLGYQLTDTQHLKASYSRRIQRPTPAQLNPFISYPDPLNQRSGNPDLEPQETDALEIVWQLRSRQSFYQASVYVRDTQRAFTEVVTDLGSAVVLTRPENLGARRDTGLELVANGQLHSTVRYNASANVFRQEIDPGDTPSAQSRSGTIATGRFSLNWQPTQADFVQFSAVWQGDSLQPQGTREAGGMINLGYRRKMTEKLAFLATVRDAFDSFREVITFETPDFRDREERRFTGRAWHLELTYAFGQRPIRPQEPQFDFAAPGN